MIGGSRWLFSFSLLLLSVSSSSFFFVLSVNKVSPISAVASWWCSYSRWIIVVAFGGIGDLGGD